MNSVHNGCGCRMNKDILSRTGWHLRGHIGLCIGRRDRSFQCRLNGQITETGMFLEVALRFEFVAQCASEIFQVLPRSCLRHQKRYHMKKIRSRQFGKQKRYYRRAIFLHGMSKFVMFRNSSREKAALAHVEAQTFQASIPTQNGARANRID